MSASNELHVQSLGTALGSVRLNVLKDIVPLADGRLAKYSKTGFENVYHSERDVGLDVLALSALGPPPHPTLTDVDYLIGVSSVSTAAPSWTYALTAKLGLRNDIRILSLQDACTGFATGLELAFNLVESNVAKKVLLVTVDHYSHFYDLDSDLAMLFSDGASAFTVSREGATHQEGKPAWWWSIMASAVCTEPGSQSALLISNRRLEMHGAAVFQFALTAVPPLVRSVLREANESMEISWFVHQGSRVVVDAVGQVLGLSQDELFRAQGYGNTVASSIPMQLQSTVRQPDGYLGLLSFGMGLTSRCMLIKERAAS